jgi:Xaa-Pro aminopeptidase
MLGRREFIAGAGALAGLANAPALAQDLRPGPGGPEGPAGTSPFPPDHFRARRRRLMDAMGGGVAVIFSADSLAYEGPVGGGPRQNPDFAYLTGIHDEAGAALVLAPQERTYRNIWSSPRAIRKRKGGRASG